MAMPTTSCDGSAGDFVHCVFCRDPQQLTKILSCFHPVCDFCLTSPDVVRDGRIKCGNCSTVTTVPRQQDSRGTGFYHLKPNNFQEVWTSFETLFEAKPCVACLAQGKNVMGSHVCLDCGEDYLCKSCLTVHATLGGTKHHKPVPIPSLKDPEYSRKLRARHHEFCAKHEATMKFYCLECQRLVCNDCLHVDHFGHNRVIMFDHCEEQRQNITRMREKLDQCLSHALWQETAFKKLVEQSFVDEDTSINEIAEQVDILKNIIDRWAKRKSSELRAFHQSSRQQYEADAARWTAASIPLKNLSILTNLYIQHASDRDLFKSMDTLKEGIAVALEQTQGVGTPLMHKIYMFQWKSPEEIETNLNAITGEAVEKECSLVQTIKMTDTKATEYITGLAVTAEGDILATGRFEGGVHIFDSNGSYKRTIEFQNPIRAFNVVTHGDEIYVSDNQLREVKRIDRDGRITHTIKLRDNEPGEVVGGIGLSVHPQTRLMYICSTDKHTVYRCALNADVAQPLITSSAHPMLNAPRYLHVTHTGQLVVTNVGGDNIHIYDSDGQFTHVLGEKGEEPWQFNGPLGVSSDKSSYKYVADWQNHRIKVIAPDNSCSSFPQGDEDFKEPFAVLVDREGDVWVSHSINKISIFRPTRRLVQS